MWLATAVGEGITRAWLGLECFTPILFSVCPLLVEMYRNLQLVRPSPDAAVLQPRGIFVNATEGEGSLQGDVPLGFCAR